jgi:hypothetical protein
MGLRGFERKDGTRVSVKEQEESRRKNKPLWKL